MADETKTVTEREAVMREREAFERGARFQYDWFDGYRRDRERDSSPGACLNAWQRGVPEVEARRLFPAPKVKRPRVVADGGGIQWRMFENYLQWRGADRTWRRTQDYHCMAIAADRITLWADLLATPDEEYEP